MNKWKLDNFFELIAIFLVVFSPRDKNKVDVTALTGKRKQLGLEQPVDITQFLHGSMDVALDTLSRVTGTWPPRSRSLELI